MNHADPQVADEGWRARTLTGSDEKRGRPAKTNDGPGPPFWAPVWNPRAGVMCFSR